MEDNLELDATDGDHSAWWRGHDFVVAQYRERLEVCRAIVEAAIKWNEFYNSDADDDELGFVRARLRLSDAVEAYVATRKESKR